MKLRGIAGAITDRDRARKREIYAAIEITANQRSGYSTDRMVAYLTDRLTNALLEVEQRGGDVEAYLDQ